MENPLKEIFERQAELMQKKREQCLDAARSSRFGQRITGVYTNAKKFRELPFYLQDCTSKYTNCVGVVGFVIGEEGTMAEIAKEIGKDDEIKVPFLGRRPGYLPPEVMGKFLEQRCFQIKKKEVQRDDLVVFKDSKNCFEHVGVYVCRVETKPVSCEMMFHQWHYGGNICFEEILDYYEEEFPDVIEYHRLKD